MFDSYKKSITAFIDKFLTKIKFFTYTNETLTDICAKFYSGFTSAFESYSKSNNIYLKNTLFFNFNDF